MKRVLLLFPMLVFMLALSAQNADLNCGSGRYSTSIFTDVTKTGPLTFGYNTVTDFITSITYKDTLRLDLYTPTADPAVKRPLVVLLFGGGFISGTRGDFEPVCIELAKRGYATATIDYRLVYPNFFNYLSVFTTESLLYDEVIKASSDLKAAIRFFKHDAATANLYKIDTTKIIVGGASSGSIASLFTAYVSSTTEVPAATPVFAANGGFEGNTDFPAPNNLLPMHNSSGIIGVLNIAGGVIDTNLITVTKPPLYTAQGDADEVVPYNYGPVSYQGVTTPLALYGANPITQRANHIGLKTQLFTIPGGNHESPGLPQNIGVIITQASAFMETLVCSSILPVTLSSFTVASNNCSPVLQWKTATEVQSSHYEVEMSNNGFNFKTVANVAAANAGAASYQYAVNTPAQKAWFRLKMVDKDGHFTYSPVQQFSSACKGLIQVYPNPAHNFASVTGLQAGMQVHIIGADGKLLWSQKATAANMQVPLSGFANGLLLVQVKDVNGKMINTGKLIKN